MGTDRRNTAADLRVETYTMPAARLGPENPLPPLYGCMPHRFQDDYDRILKDRGFRVAVL